MSNTASAKSFENPFWVDPSLTHTLRDMLTSPSPAYQNAAILAARSLQNKTLLGIQTSSRRFLITLRHFRARPVPAHTGALFQSLDLRTPPQNARDITGWIVVQDGYCGGSLVLVHEISHFANRFFVRQLLQDDISAGLANTAFPTAIVRQVRARLLDEIAARHLAYLAESSIDLGSGFPKPGALFACAVKIATYPEIYGDPGYVGSIIGRAGRPGLRDLIGSWFPALQGFSYFEKGTPLALAHTTWLREESRVAALGKDAPEVEPEGTL